MRLCFAALLCLAGAAGAGQKRTTSRVYTYFQRPLQLAQADLVAELEAIALWNESWVAAGWRTRVLGPEDARRHPGYEAALAAFVALPAAPHRTLDVQLGGYLRWLAFAAAAKEGEHGAFCCDYDLLNLGYAAPQAVPALLTSLRGASAVLSDAAGLEALAALLAAGGAAAEDLRRFARRDGHLHVSDATLLAAAVEDGVFSSAAQVPLFGTRAAKPQLLHFSAAAVRERGGGAPRASLMAAALASARPRDRDAPPDWAASARPPACAQPEDAWPADAALRPLLCAGELAPQRFCYREGGSNASAPPLCLPALVGIGFEKAGTTKLFQLLQQHPAVCGSADKEAALLLRASGAGWRDELAAQLAPAKRACRAAEFTPYYVHASGGPGAPAQLALVARAAAILPAGAVLLAGVRDPTARSLSSYRYHLLRGFDCASRPRCFRPAAALRGAVCFALRELGGEGWLRWAAGPADAPPPPYPPHNVSRQYPHWDILSDSLYAHALQPWRAAFGDQRILLFSSEALAAAPRAELERLLARLGLGLEAGLPRGSVYSEGELLSPTANAQPPVPAELRDARAEAFMARLFAPSTRALNAEFGTALPVGEEPADAEAEADGIVAEAEALCADVDSS